MSAEPHQAANTIRHIFNRTAEEGWKPESVTGASDTEIDAWAAGQGASRIPEALREAMRLIGKQHGYRQPGTSLGVRSVTEQTKRHALAALSQLSDPFVDSSGILVIAEHQAYEYQVIDGSDLGEADPPVWCIVEQESVEKRWNTVTEWFESIRPRVADYRARADLRLRRGKPLPASWSENFQIDRLT
ncbi:SMI1/KNR4 family protein [Nocardia cyriacigeorgica]|jgi:hypothetical protein|uniref:SMI1/KNR4 family protein n=1 Tax=Nocardia cyriacigeorgica TaxID=135487 RepID=UPI0024547B81|nr:SMI1/KNR4 family protein [Nocardia cyriacigeorgica]